MSKFGQSNGPPNDGADTSRPSYWNAFWLLSEPLMLKPLPAPMLLFVTWTPGASAGTSKNDVRDTAMFCTSSLLKFELVPPWTVSTTGDRPDTVTVSAMALTVSA